VVVVVTFFATVVLGGDFLGVALEEVLLGEGDFLGEVWLT